MTTQTDAFEALRAFIIKTRAESGLSQEEVARRGGLPRGTIGAIEAGRGSIPRQPTMEKLAKGLGVAYAVIDGIARGMAEAEARAMLADPGADELYRLLQSVPNDRRDLARRLLLQLVDGAGPE